MHGKMRNAYKILARRPQKNVLLENQSVEGEWY